MFSHIVVFWADPKNPAAADEIVSASKKLLQPIPGILAFHVGKMVSSPRPIVEQSYQVALNVIFATKQAQDEYQVHPLHLQFVETIVKRLCTRVLVYDFE